MSSYDLRGQVLSLAEATLMFGTCRVNVLVPHPTAVTQKLTQLGSDFHLVVGVEVTFCSVGELHGAHLG
jgi:hypothetical protein